MTNRKFKATVRFLRDWSMGSGIRPKVEELITESTRMRESFISLYKAGVLSMGEAADSIGVTGPELRKMLPPDAIHTDDTLASDPRPKSNRNPTAPKSESGWARPDASKKWHYFKAGATIALCSKWAFRGPREEGNDDSPDNCVDCRKRKAKLGDAHDKQ